ncbi:MAG: helix-turn-helix domain-containing protein [Marinibacterium sp.]|nr:helix-turn-helix domain-containing protein [Marinibacterium sp.]
MDDSVSINTKIDLLTQALLTRVGERVRRQREKLAIPRRVLSERSGVSARYLAQLESGQGNMSIVLLQRVAVALDYPLEFLISQDDPEHTSALRIGLLYHDADRAVRDDVMRLLVPERGAELRAQRVCLVGLRGAGKTTLGARAAHDLDVPFVELHHEIERDCGMSWPELQDLYGPEGYRELEAQALERVFETVPRGIIAAPGGIVGHGANYDRLLRYCHTVWISASAQEHLSRLRPQDDDGAAGGVHASALEHLGTVMQQRDAQFTRTDARLETTDRTVDQSLADLTGLIEQNGYLA